MLTKPENIKNMNQWIVGIDAGGTNIRIAASNPKDPLQSSSPLMVAAAEDGGPEPLRVLSEWGRIDRAQTVSVAAGITKVSRAGVVQRWEIALQSLFPNAVVQVVPDFQIAFHGAVPGGIGVAALAGTGTVLYGENVAGDAVRVGGRGWEYGDEGSGTWLTTELLRRTIRGMDGIDVLTPLCRAACERLGETEDAGRLAEAARRESEKRGRVFLVPLILQMSEAGDVEAINLFVGAAGWIAAQTRAALNRLKFENDGAVKIARVGGLWDVGPFLTGPYAEVIGRWYPRAVIAPEDAPPIAGALRLAEQGFRVR